MRRRGSPPARPKTPDPPRVETEYLVAARRAAARKQRGLVVGSLAVAAVSIGLLIFALISRSAAVSQALTSDAERVGAQALTEKTLDLSMLYAVLGVKLQNRLETRSDLLAVLQHSPEAIRLLRPSRNEIRALAVDPAGRLLATGDSGGVLRFEKMASWAPSGSAVRLPGTIFQKAMAFSPRSDTLALLSEQGSPQGLIESGNTSLYAVDVGARKVRRLGYWHGVIPLLPDPAGGSLAYSPDGRHIALAIASGRPDGSIGSDTLRLLDSSDGRVVWRRSYPWHPGQHAVQVQFAPGGALLTSAQQGQTLLWNARTGRVLRRFPIGGELAVAGGHTIAVGVNSPSIVAASSRVAVIDLRTGHYRFLPAELSSEWVKTLALTPDGKGVVGATIHGGTYIWDTASGSISHTIAAPVGAIGIAALDPAGRTLLIGSRDGSVTAFDLSGSRRLGRAFQWNRPDQSCPSPPCFVVNRQGDLMATDQGDGSIALIDLRTLRLAATLPARNGPFAPAIAFFPDGRTLLAGGVSGRITIWDTRAHTVVRTFAMGAPVLAGAVSPDSQLMAVQTQSQTSSSVVQVRPIGDGKPLWSAHVQDGASAVYFSPDGRTVSALGCCTALSTVVAWDARTGRLLFRRRLSTHATAIAFSPDSHMLAVGTENGEVGLWGVQRGRPMAAPLQVGSASVEAMSFSPDGKLLAISSSDESTTLWNLRARKQVGDSFPSRPNVITVPMFAPNGQLLIDYLADAAEWPINVGTWERFACQVAGRNLTQAEWRDILPNRSYMRLCP